MEWLSEDGRWRQRTFQPFVLKGYRKRTGDANLVTIDGGGHYLDGRWLGSRIPLARVSEITHFATVNDVTYCCANLAPDYTDDCGLSRFTRRWVFFRDTGIVVMMDCIVAQAPHAFAWCVHASDDTWKPRAKRCFGTGTDGHALLVHAVDSITDETDQAVTCSVTESPWVPSYTTGLNAYKTRNWQPEIQPEKAKVPSFLVLQFAPVQPVSSWTLLTVMGVDAADVEVAAADRHQGMPGVRFPSGRAVHFPDNEAGPAVYSMKG